MEAFTGKVRVLEEVLTKSIGPKAIKCQEIKEVVESVVLFQREHQTVAEGQESERNKASEVVKGGQHAISEEIQRLKEYKDELESERNTLHRNLNCLQDELASDEKNLKSLEEQYRQNFDTIAENRRRLQLLLGLTLGQTTLGSELTYQLIDPKEPAREFKCCIRLSAKRNTIVDTNPQLPDVDQINDTIKAKNLQLEDIAVLVRKRFRDHRLANCPEDLCGIIKRFFMANNDLRCIKGNCQPIPVDIDGNQKNKNTVFQYFIGEDKSLIETDDFNISKLVCNLIPNYSILLNSPLPNYKNDDEAFFVEINHWIDFAFQLYLDINEDVQNKKQLIPKMTKKLLEVDQHLLYRTFLVGYQLTLADICLYSGIGQTFGFNNISNNLDDVQDLKQMSNLKRWLSLIHSINPIPAKIMKSIETVYPKNSRSQKEDGHLRNQYEGKLPGAIHGQVVTRFPPEPSGYLHIGHAKAALLNSYYATSYHGKLIIRFDDTNPVKEKMEYEESILEDLKLLNIFSNHISHTSDYFDVLQTHCEKLINKGRKFLAVASHIISGMFYADDSPIEQMRYERGEGINSPNRDNSVEENLRRWIEMKNGSQEGITNCIRAKIDMRSKNKCMRDPVMYRCVIDVPHHIHGTKYKVYPMYDFACPIVDSLEGVTHAMRTNEYCDRIPQYEWVIAACGLRPVVIYEFSRLNLVNTVLSKRKLQWLVDHQVVESWEDPRFPTVRGVRRRGLTPQALMEFILEQGPSKNVNLMEWDKLWAKNKQVIDPIVPRFMAVDVEGVRVVLLNGPDPPELRERDLHPKNVNIGKGMQVHGKEILIEKEDAEMMEVNEEITLMRWCNAIIHKIKKSEDDQKIIEIEMHLNPDGDFKKTKKKIHWLTISDRYKPVPIILREYDHIITKKKPEETDALEDIINQNSVFDTLAVCDMAIATFNKGDMLQFERRGYFIYDSLHHNNKQQIFIKIPVSPSSYFSRLLLQDGKSKAMSVVSTKVDAGKLAKGQ